MSSNPKKRTSDQFASPLLFKREFSPPNKKRKAGLSVRVAKVAPTQRLARLCQNLDVPERLGFQFKDEKAKTNFSNAKFKEEQTKTNFSNAKAKLKNVILRPTEDKTNGKDWISYPLERTETKESTDSPNKCIAEYDTESLYTKIEKRTENFHSLTKNVVINDNLKLQYIPLFPVDIANHILYKLENEVEYYGSELSKVRIFGMWKEIPRKQVAYGDPGLKYTFSGNTVPAKPWTELMSQLRKIVSVVAQFDFNFVLVNRYKDGADCIGWHRDDEPDLEEDAPIASLSFGQKREFCLKPITDRSKPKVKIMHALSLEHGSLVVMEAPTNKFWLHSLPKRKGAVNPRVNLTFRKILKRD